MCKSIIFANWTCSHSARDIGSTDNRSHDELCQFWEFILYGVWHKITKQQKNNWNNQFPNRKNNYKSKQSPYSSSCWLFSVTPRDRNCSWIRPRGESKLIWLIWTAGIEKDLIGSQVPSILLKNEVTNPAIHPSLSIGSMGHNGQEMIPKYLIE